MGLPWDLREWLELLVKPNGRAQWGRVEVKDQKHGRQQANCI